MNCVFTIILLARNDTNKRLKLGLIFKLSDQNFIITNNRSESDHLRDKYVCLNNSYILGYKKSVLIFFGDVWQSLSQTDKKIQMAWTEHSGLAIYKFSVQAEQTKKLETEILGRNHPIYCN